jgi:hypothetical protein
MEECEGQSVRSREKGKKGGKGVKAKDISQHDPQS